MHDASLSETSKNLPLLVSKDRAGKYLIFHLGTEDFGTEVLKVREIMGLQDITTVPQTPNYVKGVINLRGKVIPVVDLRLKFELAPEEYTARTCIVVVRTSQAGVEMMIGIIVDGVAEVLTLREEDIEDTPDFGPGIETPYVNGMAKIKGKVKILLDIDQVLSTKEMNGLSALLQ
ncbi:MAG: CheW protein [Acidobacteriaceae bacterium]|nr:CheW protein [Acidobacteriaceae bacterium]